MIFQRFLRIQASGIFSLERRRTDGTCASHHNVLGKCSLLTVILLFSLCVDETARPNPFGMPGIVPPYVPPQMLNIPQTSLQAKPMVRPFLSCCS